MVRYRYDGWGNHVVLNPDGSKNESDTFIGNINPFRYRGYYYDAETGLYYLKTRYYDPETGRFITIDDVSYLAPDTINGLNLYAYCGNNPVMRIDENGNAWWNPFSWDWGKIGKRIIGAIAATLGTGLALQVAVSTISYVGMAIGAIFSEDIRSDMNRIHWNPFNSDEELVLKSKYVSFYKGVPVFRIGGNRSGTFGGIFLTRETNYRSNAVGILKHEWGHSVQQIILGPIIFFIGIALPSAGEWQKDKWGDYYLSPWEITADMIGGVDNSSVGQTELARKRGVSYLRILPFLGLFSILGLFSAFFI